MPDRPALPSRVQALVLVSFFVLFAVGAGAAAAGDSPPETAPADAAPEAAAPAEAAAPEAAPPETAPTDAAPPESVPPEAVPSESAPEEAAPPMFEPIEEFIEDTAAAAVKVVDETHARLERGILGRVRWFDDFFGGVRAEDLRQPDYLLRWRNSLRWEEGGRFKYRTSVRASLRLPKITERLRLVVAGENEAEPAAASLPEDPGNPGFDRTLQNTRLVNTELRYGVVQKPDLDVFLGAGVRLKLPVEYFARTRFLYTLRFAEVYLARLGETLFWKDVEGVGETTEVSLERQLDPKTVLRWANSGTLAKSSQGLEWGTDLSWLRELSPRRAVTVAAGVFGNTRPEPVVQTYRILVRYRQNLFRRWLFCELEPEVTWPRDPAGAYASTFALTFRVEIVFQGSAAGKGRESGSP